DHAAVGRTDAADLRLVGTDAAVEARTLQCCGAIESAHGIVGAQSDRTYRWTMLAEIIANEGVVFGVENDVDLALPVQRDALGAAQARAHESQAFQQLPERLPRLGVDGELDEGKAREPWCDRRIEQFDAIEDSCAAPLLCGLEPAAHLPLEIEQRAHGVDG